jgi:hypothetical protein
MEKLLQKRKETTKPLKSKGWKVLILSNKGAFFSPKTYKTKMVCEQEIERLKKRHKHNAEVLGHRKNHWNGTSGIIPHAYIAYPVNI